MIVPAPHSITAHDACHGTVTPKIFPQRRTPISRATRRFELFRMIFLIDANANRFRSRNFTLHQLC
jgi:hypothetical protein